MLCIYPFFLIYLNLHIASQALACRETPEWKYSILGFGYHDTWHIVWSVSGVHCLRSIGAFLPV